MFDLFKKPILVLGAKVRIFYFGFRVSGCGFVWAAILPKRRKGRMFMELKGEYQKAIKD